MKKIIMITLVSLIVNTNIIYAECTSKDTDYFKSIEDKYQITYEFNKDTKTYTLNLTYGDISSFSYELLGDGMANATSSTADNKIIIESYIKSRELECAVLKTNKIITSSVGEIRSSNTFYDYEAKYNKPSSLIIPANIPKELSTKIKELSIKI